MAHREQRPLDTQAGPDRSGTNDAEAAEAARASDIEQQLGRAGNSSDSSRTGEAHGDHATPADIVGGSGHIVRGEIVEAAIDSGGTGSPGADADRAAAERGSRRGS